MLAAELRLDRVGLTIVDDGEGKPLRPSATDVLCPYHRVTCQTIGSDSTSAPYSHSEDASVVSIQDGRATLRQCRDQFAFLCSYRLNSAKRIEVVGPDVGNYTNLRLHQFERSFEGNPISPNGRGDLLDAKSVPWFNREDCPGNLRRAIRIRVASPAFELAREYSCDELFGSRFATTARYTDENDAAKAHGSIDEG
jgi:hypothetical protein